MLPVDRWKMWARSAAVKYGLVTASSLADGHRLSNQATATAAT